MAAAVLGLPNAAELASTPAAAITDRICRVRYSVPPTRLGDTAVPLLICGFGVRVPGGAPGGLHVSVGPSFTFESDSPAIWVLARWAGGVCCLAVVCGRFPLVTGRLALSGCGCAG